MSELDEDDLSKWNGCLQDGRRENVQQLFHQLIHTPENLFYGGSTANVALGNRPDITDDARGVLGYDHVDKLLSWWIYTMKRLGLNPKEEWVDNIYWAFTEKYIRKKLFSHDLSRPLGPLFGNPSELG
ncbi:MAG: hypothetical protein J1E64_08380 [Acetatifactor sp.]|nr:hypothetical protein [Acetatifactor sp.]